MGVDRRQKLPETLLGSFQVRGWFGVQDDDNPAGAAGPGKYLPSLVDPVTGRAAGMAEGKCGYLMLGVLDCP